MTGAVLVNKQALVAALALDEPYLLKPNRIQVAGQEIVARDFRLS